MKMPIWHLFNILKSNSVIPDALFKLALMVFGNRNKKIASLTRRIAALEAENDRINNTLQKTGVEDRDHFNLPFLLKFLELTGIGIWVKTIESEALWLSLSAKEIMGFKSDITISTDQLKSSILPEDRPIFEKALNEILQDGKVAEIELKIARHEGDSREFRLISMQISCIKNLNASNGDLFTIIGSIKDITRQDKARRDLIKAKEKAEESERLKNTLLTDISHEIRTPMNSIIGFSELLNIGNLPYDKRLEYVKTIKNQGILLLKMIDDVVELIRMETGKITIRKSPCNIDLLINELLSIFNRVKFSQNKEYLEIRVKYPEKRGMVIYTDPGRLQQLISNLISNSIKYTEKGWIEIGYKPLSEQRIEFYVNDTGIGISRDLQKKIFGHVADEDSLTGKPEGSGLGLTIAKNLIRLMGGKIWVESELGQGSTFFFTIPYEEVPDTYHKMAPEEEFVLPSYTWKDKVILVVEDDEVNCKFLEAVLQDTAAQILYARNGIQAVELCRTINKIDLVLMDIKMPDMDGFEATRQIREFNRKVPVIAQTAFVLESEWSKCQEAGCNDQITKPINIKEFFEKVDKFLKEH
jgi:signal transduction histidine kinase/CheY-like chemotaxis protein